MESVTLKGALFIPSYPQGIFSVKSATANGAAITFKKNKNELIHKNGTKFNIFVHNRLYYLMSTTNKSEDSCQGCYDINTWHRILGHCNYDDIRKLPKAVKGMKIKEKIVTQNKNCEICIQWIFFQSRNRQPDRRTASTFELIHRLSWPYRTSRHKQAQICNHIYWWFFRCNICVFFKNKERHCICHKEIYRWYCPPFKDKIPKIWQRIRIQVEWFSEITLW